MGKRGPKGKPTNVRLLHGDRPSRINHHEPQPPAGEVEPPEDISDAARQVWDRLAPQLERVGVLTPWDVDSLRVFCDAVVHNRQASRLVAQSSVLIKGRKDALVKNPAMQVVRDTADTIARFGDRFGLSPAARSQIVMGTPARDERERLLS